MGKVTRNMNRHVMTTDRARLRCGRAGRWLFRAVVLCSLLFLSAPLRAQEAVADTLDEDFVIASVVVADPGQVLYSRVGHIGLHMQCPKHRLDYVFSYESEDVRRKVPAFLAGKLKMGMFAIPTEEYLEEYRREGRGVREYRLNLPVKVKQELWRVLDNHMLEGPNLPYDYITYGCAHSALMMIKEALDTIPIDYGEWPERFHRLNRRELTARYMADSSPWSWCFLNLISNGSINSDCPLEDKLIMPLDLVEVLQGARVLGRPLLDSQEHLLLDGAPMQEKGFVTPLAVALVVLALTLVCLFWKKNWMDYVLLAVQTLLGVVTVYLVFFSSLCCTEWSWLIVPFNPLPLLAWHWRRHWALPYAGMLVVWVVAMLAWPHSLTDSAYIVLTLALVVSYIHIYLAKKTTKI